MNITHAQPVTERGGHRRGDVAVGRTEAARTLNTGARPQPNYTFPLYEAHSSLDLDDLNKAIEQGQSASRASESTRGKLNYALIKARTKCQTDSQIWTIDGLYFGFPVFDSGPAENQRQKMSWSKYHRLATIHAYMRELEISHPKIVTVFSIGKTFEGRDLLGGGL